MDKELVSVVIPTYNRKAVLENAIKSVLDQTYKNIEIIVVDDASTDNSEDVVKAFQDSRIRYIRLEKNGGPSKARNVGIIEAKGKLIAFQDSDDFWYENKLDEEMQEMQKDENCQMVFCKYKCNSGSDRVVPIDDDFSLMPGKEGFLKILLGGNKIGTPTVLAKKDILLKAGMFNESLYTLEDWELFLRIAEIGTIRFVKKVLVGVNDSIDGVNFLRGVRSAKTELLILSQYWDKYKDKLVFKNLISSILEDLDSMSCDEAMECTMFLRKYELSEVYIGLITEHADLVKKYKKNNAYQASKLNELKKYDNYLQEKLDEYEKCNTYLQEKLNEYEKYNSYLQEKLNEYEKYNGYLQEKLGAHEKYVNYLLKKQERYDSKKNRS